jgi:heme exporter protein C
MQPKPAALKALDAVCVVLLAAATYLALVYAPTEAVMGQVQRVFYFHVSTAWVGMLGFLAAAVAGAAYLRTRDQKWDIVEVAAVEISLVFFLMAIVFGSIWARPIWNTWWTWDPRLSTAAITELIYIAYFMLREGIENPDVRARIAAVYTLIGSVSVPITFMAIRMYRTIHPVVIGSGQGDTLPLAPGMKVAFFFALFSFTVIFTDLFWNRIRMGWLARQVEQLKLDLVP